jgi:hypothetical protein
LCWDTLPASLSIREICFGPLPRFLDTSSDLVTLDGRLRELRLHKWLINILIECCSSPLLPPPPPPLTVLLP